MERNLDAHVISTEEAIAQGSTAGEISAVANYHIRKHQTLKAILNRPHHRNNGHDIKREMKTTSFIVDSLISIARDLRKIGRVR